MRVLHVVGRMNPGGVETWLLQVFQTADPRSVRFDVMVHDDREGAYDREIMSLGVRIFHNSHFKNPLRYYRRLRQIVGSPCRYDVIHSHVHHYSGMVLTLGAYLGTRIRVAHSHNDTTEQDANAAYPRRAYLRSMAWLVSRAATNGAACSAPAAKALFGQRWLDDSRWRLLYCGIDPARFNDQPDRQGVRAEFDLPVDSEILIHVGRFDPQKNHTFLADIFHSVSTIRPSAFLMLVGTGSLRPIIEARLKKLGVADRVRFCGQRSDVPRLLKAADVFVFPSLHEGLPLVCLEAQAAHLPVVMSDRITPEVIINPANVAAIALESPQEWAHAIEAAITNASDLAAGHSPIQGGPFDISRSTAALLEFYAESGRVHGVTPICSPT